MKTTALEGKLAFGDPFLDSGVVGIAAGAESIVGARCFYVKSKKIRVLGFSV